MVRAVLFDLDGTLVDTPRYNAFIVQKALVSLGKSLRCPHDVDLICYTNERDSIVKSVYNIEPQDFWDRLNELDLPEVRRPFVEVYRDTVVLKELRSRNYVLGIVTGSPKHIADVSVDVLGVNFFGAIVSANPNNGLSRKPSPEGLMVCMYHLGLQPSQCVYVGNGGEDVEAARNAGMLDIFLDRKQYDASKIVATHKISSLFELLDIF